MAQCSDSEVKEEGFLEYINQLLMTGEVTGLFPKDELDTLINEIRPIYRAECPGAKPCRDTIRVRRLASARAPVLWLHLCS